MSARLAAPVALLLTVLCTTNASGTPLEGAVEPVSYNVPMHPLQTGSAAEPWNVVSSHKAPGSQNWLIPATVASMTALGAAAMAAPWQQRARATNITLAARPPDSLALEVLFEVLEDSAVLELDAEGQIIKGNKTTAQIFAWPQEEPPSQFAALFSEDAQEQGAPAGLLARAKRESESLDEGWLMRADGTPFWAQTKVVTIQSPPASPTGFIAFIEERSAPQSAVGSNAYATIDDAAHAARLAQEDIVNLAYAASHDLRQPVRSIRGYLDVVSAQALPHLDTSGQDFLTRAVAAGHRMEALIDGLVAFSRAVSQGSRRGPVDLNATVAHVQQKLASEIERSGAVIEADNLPTVHGSVEQIECLMEQLVANAIKFADTARPPLIRIHAAMDNDKHHIEIQDNGIGIQETNLARMFELFVQLHPSDAYEGAGIGLAIAQRICHAHGGSLTATSEVGVGTTMHIKVPKGAGAGMSHAGAIP